MAAMQEIELKFQIPAHALEALRAEVSALSGGQAAPQKLQAAYFDTPDRKLARARAALRVRQEDDDWVQTLKAAGAHAMTRLEDNQPVPAFTPDQAIRPDLSRHQDEAVRQALMRDLGWQPDGDPTGAQTGLVQLYRTDMLRQRAHVNSPEADPILSGQLEIALDTGRITAAHLHVPVRELEVELLNGHAQAVLDCARGLVVRHGLWLDTQTKAHRGDQLAREAASGLPSPRPPVRPQTPASTGQSALQHWLGALDAALDQVCANASEVALYESATPMDVTPWIKAWAHGLRRLRRTWLYAPEGLLARTLSAEQVTSVPVRISEQLRLLRPQAGTWASPMLACQLARSTAPTLLALDVLQVIVRADTA